jgi:hypothetical protein
VDHHFFPKCVAQIQPRLGIVVIASNQARAVFLATRKTAKTAIARDAAAPAHFEEVPVRLTALMQRVIYAESAASRPPRRCPGVCGTIPPSRLIIPSRVPDVQARAGAQALSGFCPVSVKQMTFRAGCSIRGSLAASEQPQSVRPATLPRSGPQACGDQPVWPLRTLQPLHRDRTRHPGFHSTR